MIFRTFHNIRAKFGISNSLQSLDIGQNAEEDIFNFWISGQSLLKGNCHKSFKETKHCCNHLTMMSHQQNVTSWSIFPFIANLE